MTKGGARAEQTVAGWGSRTKHPLYDTWSALRLNHGASLGAWYDDFWAYVRDVSPKPGKGYKLRRHDLTKPIGPDNFIWLQNLSTHADRLRRYRNERSPDFLERQKETTLKRRFNLSPGTYQKMLAAQASLCAICKRHASDSSMDPRTGKPFRFHVDHDHETDEIRGLLCHLCNVMLGSARDNPDILRAAADYLEKAKLPDLAVA